MKKEPRLLKVGVLGCGPISQAAHFDACCKARNVELYAICDVAADLLAKMAATHEPQVTYNDYDAMLVDPKVEAVIVAVADQFHVALSEKALAAGKHVFVEKPLGVGVEECEGLRHRLQGTGLVLQVGNNRRFDPGVAFAQRFICEEIGQLQALKAWYYDSTYRYTMTDNLQPLVATSPGIRRPEGNLKADRRRYLLLGHGSHLLDTARYLGGEIVSVRARLTEVFGAYCWFIDVDYANGCLGHLDLNIPIRGESEEGFQAFGEFGSARGQSPLTWFHKAGNVECFSTKTGQYVRPLGEDAYTYKLQLEAFADTILNGTPMRAAGIDDGVAAMRAMVAVARSVERGESVCLADVTGAV